MRRRPWEIDRRACLRGAGMSLGLPLLEAMLPGVKRARAGGVSSPKRCVLVIFAGGAPDTSIMTGRGAADPNEGRRGSFRPSTTGPDYQLTPILEPFQARAPSAHAADRRRFTPDSGAYGKLSQMRSDCQHAFNLE